MRPPILSLTPQTKPEWSAVSDTVSPVKGARLGGLLARGLIGGAAAIIVVVATLLTWPWSVVGPSPDQRRIADLQRLSHAIDAFRARQHVLPASLARLPIEPAAPVHTHDPITNRPYDYRPLGPLAYELCARFDAAGPEEQRGFWWHDGGRYCFSLETREGPKRPAAAAQPGGAGAVRDSPSRTCRPQRRATTRSRLRRDAVTASCTFRATARATCRRRSCRTAWCIAAAAVEIEWKRPRVRARPTAPRAAPRRAQRRE